MHVPCSRLGTECFLLLLQHVVSCLAVVFFPVCSTLGGGFNPEYEKARLHGPDGTRYPRLRIARGWQRFHKSNGHRITVEDDRVLVYRGHDTEGPPHVLSVGGQYVRWLGAAKGIAFFVAEDTGKEVVASGRHGMYLPAEIRRLDLSSLSWLPSWRIEPELEIQPEHCQPDKAAPPIAVLGRVLTNDGTVVVLTYTMAEKSPWSSERKPGEEVEETASENCDCINPLVYHEPLSYQITRFDPEKDRPIWSKSFQWAEQAQPPAMVATGIWGGTDHQLEILTWLESEPQEDSLLVCAGDKQDLLSMYVEDGQQRWRIAKIWEFERGYVGPSIFEYFVERFGIGPLDLDPEQSLIEARNHFEETHEGRITAGPVVVPNHGEDHLFIATARRLKSKLGAGHEAPEQSWVYELEVDSGQMIALTTLPRIVKGRPFRTMPGSLIWSCTRRSLIRLHHHEFDFSAGLLGPGWRSRNDALCRVAWYREYLMQVPPSWFWADPPSGVAAFGPKHMFRPGAAYIRDENEKIYRFVISIIHLETGLECDLMLVIPFSGEFSVAGHGYAKTARQTHAMQPDVLRISDLSVDEEVLRVVMKELVKGGKETAIEFKRPAPSSLLQE